MGQLKQLARQLFYRQTVKILLQYQRAIKLWDFKQCLVLTAMGGEDIKLVQKFITLLTAKLILVHWGARKILSQGLNQQFLLMGHFAHLYNINSL